MQPRLLALTVSQSYSKLKSVIEKHSGPIVITSHKQADPDALGSAMLLYYILKNISQSDIQIVMPTLSKQTDKITSEFNFQDSIQKKILSPMVLKETCIILVDTNQPLITDLGSIFANEDSLFVWQSCKTRIIIDHHLLENQPANTETVPIVYPKYTSNSELVFELLVESTLPMPGKGILSVGLLGILFDTKRLQLASATTLQNVAKILEELQATVEDYIHYLENFKEFSERVANVKTAQRNKLVILQEAYLLSLSFVSSFESSSARALQYLGSDIAVVINRSKEEIRISFRATKRFYEATGVHCGELAKMVAEQFSGTGSGHPTAAGCNLTPQPSNNELFDFITKSILKNMESKKVSE